MTDPALWRVLLCLPAGVALPMALQALGQRTNPEAQVQLTKLATRNGVGATLLTYLDGRGDPLMSRPDMDAVHQLLRDPDGLNTAPHTPLPVAADLVEVATRPDANALSLTGFHPPDPDGLWTAHPKATLRAIAPPDHPVTALTGAAALLSAALDRMALTVTVEATEETTGRTARWSDTRPQGSDPNIDWVLPLPRFTGPLRIDLTLPACHSPKALGASSDPRPLGLMLRSLRFESAPAQLEAAE